MLLELKIAAPQLVAGNGRQAKRFVQRECLAMSRDPIKEVEVGRRTFARVAASARAWSGPAVVDPWPAVRIASQMLNRRFETS